METQARFPVLLSRIGGPKKIGAIFIGRIDHLASTRKLTIKAALLQVHSIIGLTFGLVLAVVGITGAIMSFEDEIQAGLNSDLAHVEARAEPKLMPDELMARVRASTGVDKIAAIMLSSDPTATVRIGFERASDGSRPSSVYVDPYDGRVLGAAVGESFFATVRALHRWLLIPGGGRGYGRLITGVAVIGLIVMLVSGLVLRWPHRSSVKVWLKPQFRLRGRGLYRTLHAVFGTWVMVIYLVISLTGLWYSFDWYRNGVRWLLSPSGTAQQAGGPAGGATRKPAKEAEGPLTLDPVWTAFLKSQGQRFATMQMILPNAGTIVRIRSWAQGTGHGERDEFRVNAVNGKMISSQLYADKTLGESIIAQNLDIHRGSILGWPGKLLFMLAALLMPVFAVTGLLLYLSRRRHQRLMQEGVAQRAISATADGQGSVLKT